MRKGECRTHFCMYLGMTYRHISMQRPSLQTEESSNSKQIYHFRSIE